MSCRIKLYWPVIGNLKNKVSFECAGTGKLQNNAKGLQNGKLIGNVVLSVLTSLKSSQ